MARAPLLRFVVSPPDERGNGTLIFDATEKLPGRGCYVTADPALLQHAIEKKLFARALKEKVTVAADLPAQVVTALTARVLSGLGLAKKAGALALGEDAVTQSLRSDRAALLLIASDASERTAGDLVRSATNRHIPVMHLPLASHALGPALGRDNSTYLSLLKGDGSTALLRDCARLAPFVTRFDTKAGNHG